MQKENKILACNCKKKDYSEDNKGWKDNSKAENKASRSTNYLYLIKTKKMSKIRIDGFDYEWNEKMSPEDFVSKNEGHYSEIACESDPQNAHKINDGDFDAMFEALDIETIKEDMIEVYAQFLEDNY